MTKPGQSPTPRNTETPIVVAFCVAPFLAALTVSATVAIISFGFTVGCLLVYAALRRLRMRWAPSAWQRHVVEANRFSMGAVIALVHTAHIAIAGVASLWVLSVVLFHVDPRLHSWHLAVVNIAHAVAIDAGQGTDATAAAARICTAIASLIGIAMFALMVAGLTKVFDAVFGFRGSERGVDE